jgi:hypothetical protein
MLRDSEETAGGVGATGVPETVADGVGGPLQFARASSLVSLLHSPRTRWNASVAAVNNSLSRIAQPSSARECSQCSRA